MAVTALAGDIQTYKRETKNNNIQWPFKSPISVSPGAEDLSVAILTIDAVKQAMKQATGRWNMVNWLYNENTHKIGQMNM